uniref:Uncharacterized protein n=1 Tax=Anguilla anguilla TaxID=7936 RepID=A0A0E9VS74_ANGAN
MGLWAQFLERLFLSLSLLRFVFLKVAVIRENTLRDVACVSAYLSYSFPGWTGPRGL